MWLQFLLFQDEFGVFKNLLNALRASLRRFQLCGGVKGFLLAPIPARHDLQLHGHSQILWQALLLRELNHPVSRFRFESIPVFQF
jgi:hypothetical protein